MAKEGLDGASVEAFLRDAARRTGWALCIGTGASMPRAIPRVGDEGSAPISTDESHSEKRPRPLVHEYKGQFASTPDDMDELCGS